MSYFKCLVIFQQVTTASPGAMVSRVVRKPVCDSFFACLGIVRLKIPALIGEWSVRALWIEEYLEERSADKAKRNQTTKTKDQLLRRWLPFVPQGKPFGPL
jgi:hypothetical protein